MEALNNIFYICGANEFLVSRSKRLFLSKKENEGYFIEIINDVLPSSFFDLFNSKKLYSLNLDSFKEDAVIDWVKSIDTSNLVFIYSIKKSAKLCNILNSSNFKEFKAPDFFKQSEDSEKFLINELKNYNKNLPSKLAKIIVQRCGTDYGILAFEALKIKLSCESADIEISNLQGILSNNLETPIASFLEAIGNKSDRDIIRLLPSLPKSLGDGGVISLCSYLTPSVLKWLAAGILQSEGKTLGESATFLELNPWYYENKVLPTAQKWGVVKLQQLNNHLAKSQRLTLEGNLDPWGYFEAGMLRLLEMGSL